MTAEPVVSPPAVVTANQVADQLEVLEDAQARLSREMHQLMLSRARVDQASVDRLYRLVIALGPGAAAHTQLSVLWRANPDLLTDGALVLLERRRSPAHRVATGAAERAQRTWGKRL